MNNPITIQTTVNAPMEKIWEFWNKPEHITKWAYADESWEAPNAENDLRTGGKFKTRMEAKDKSAGFDFEGTYTVVEEHALIEYDMPDGRHVKYEFSTTPEGVKIVGSFDPEQENSLELQRAGWQAILDNFKKYAESN